MANTRRSRWRAILFIGLLLLAGTAFAASDGDQQFSEGLRAFNAGDYQKALDAFEAARAAGRAGVDLDYNLGVTQFRLGDYAAARASFLRVARHAPMAALAHYNLGLVALREDDRAAARHHFQLAYQQTRDTKLRALARIRLDRLRDERVADRAWTGLAQLGLGHDDNVIEPDLLQPSAQSDSYLELFAVAGGPLTGTNAHGLRLELIGYALAYRDLDIYDMAFGRATLAWAAPRGAWRSEFGVYGDYSTLGGDPYLASSGPVLRAARAITPHTDLDLRYRYSRIDARDPAYAPLDGTRQQAEIALDWRRDASGLRTSAEFEHNDRSDLRVSGGFTSYSPMRHGLRTVADLPPIGAWRPALELGFRVSRYNDPNIVGGAAVTREDQRYQAAARLVRELGHRWQLHLEYLYTDNTSNLAAYDYRRNLVSLGVAWVY